jgi:hypothetical protein
MLQAATITFSVMVALLWEVLICKTNWQRLEDHWQNRSNFFLISICLSLGRVQPHALLWASSKCCPQHWHMPFWKQRAQKFWKGKGIFQWNGVKIHKGHPVRYASRNLWGWRVCKWGRWGSTVNGGEGASIDGRYLVLGLGCQDC